MKKSLSIILLGALPIIALAAGAHSGGKNMGDMHKSMASMHQDAEVSSAGQAGDPAKVSRTIEISMDDNMRFSPNMVSVKVGETIRFFLKNNGKLAHEIVLGTTQELKQHAEMMRKMPAMKHASANMATLAPGQRGGIVWQFSKAGAVDFACLVPGHMELGMIGKVMVE